MPVEKFQLVELMEQVPALMQEAFEGIRGYSTSFIVNSVLIGSGTFVRIDGIAGVLTARHVWDKLCEVTRDDPMIGLQLYERKHAFFVDRRTLVPLFSTEIRSPAFGPDLEFLKLPLLKIGPIEASQKAFYNLSKDLPKRQRNAQTRFGCLVVSGYPEEMTKKKSVGAGSVPVLHLFNLGIVVARTRTRQIGGFDYWEMKTEVKTRPHGYGGVSGGGVWRVVLEKKIGTPFSAAKLRGISLGGVAFYQSDVHEDWRFIRAHGPNTIYRVLPRKIARA